MTRNYHGLRNTRLYSIWSNIKTRCFNNHDPHYERWGGRGISMCDEWRNNFKTFYDWAIQHGYAPDLQIDRIDNNGDYTPNNCRWVSITEQNRNKRNIIFITYNNVTKTADGWAKQLHLGHDTVRQRYHRGWTAEECLFGKVR